MNLAVYGGPWNTISPVVRKTSEGVYHEYGTLVITFGDCPVPTSNGDVCAILEHLSGAE